MFANHLSSKQTFQTSKNVSILKNPLMGLAWQSSGYDSELPEDTSSITAQGTKNPHLAMWWGQKKKEKMKRFHVSVGGQVWENGRNTSRSFTPCRNNPYIEIVFCLFSR